VLFIFPRPTPTITLFPALLQEIKKDLLAITALFKLMSNAFFSHWLDILIYPNASI
jgi:hypothetical protein